MQLMDAMYIPLNLRDRLSDSEGTIHRRHIRSMDEWPTMDELAVLLREIQDIRHFDPFVQWLYNLVDQETDDNNLTRVNALKTFTPSDYNILVKTTPFAIPSNLISFFLHMNEVDQILTRRNLTKGPLVVY